MIESYIKKYRFVIIGCIFLIGIVIYLLINIKPAKSEEPLPNLPIQPPVEEVASKIIVDVKGAVVTPGIYELEVGERVFNAIEKSGGLKEGADTSVLNLSKQLRDEDVIVVYTSKEVRDMLKEDKKVLPIEKECVCPKLENNACIQKPVEGESGKISLNTATIEQLETLPGIGNSKAQLIIDYRNQTPFKTIEDLKNIKGIGDAIFNKIKDYIIP